MKDWLKRLSKSSAMRSLICAVGIGYIKLVQYTSRIEHHVHADSQAYFNGEHPAIFALWHSRIMMIQSFKPPSRQMTVLVSNHSDGRMIGNVLSGFGIDHITGSTSKGGAAALRALVHASKHGNNLAITPDGPRGPAEYASEGVAQLALLAGTPVICVGYSATRCKRLRSWDRCMIPLPFATLIFTASAPIIVPEHDNKRVRRDMLRETIESGINHVTRDADTRAGIAA